MADVGEDEVAALTPKPASPEKLSPQDWVRHHQGHAKALHARLIELQTEAGIRRQVERLEDGPLFPRIDPGPINLKAYEADQEREKQHYRFGVRRLYFAVEDETLRKRLIRLHRARDVASLRFHEAEHWAVGRALAEAKAHVRPWATRAMIDAVVATLVGAYFGHLVGLIDAVRQIADGATVQVGAVAGAAGSLISAIRMRDERLGAHAREIADAQEALAESDRFYQSVLDEPETFTGWEEDSGKPGEDV